MVENLAIVGGPRLKGNINYLVDQALEEARELGSESRMNSPSLIS